MKEYEKILRDNLLGQTKVVGNDLLPNVRKAMGAVGNVKGNPLTKTEITLQITTLFTDSFDVAVAPSALPSELQLPVPLWLFGLTDWYGGYTKITRLVPPAGGVVDSIPIIATPWYKQSNILGTNIKGYTGSQGSFLNSEFGDMVITFKGVSSLPKEYRCYVKIHCGNVSYGTFLNSFVSDLITINTIRYIIPIANVDQFKNPLIFGYQTLFGKTFSDNIDPRMYITSKDFQQQICDIPISLPIDKAVMLGTQINFDCQNISMVLFVDKIEALTHK